jgi:tetratricopeptide (TPR) repeat protein
MRRELAVIAIALAMSPAAARTAHADAASTTAPEPKVPSKEDAMSVEELDRLMAPAVDGNAGARRAASRPVENLGPEATGAITKKLAELRKAPTPEVLSAVKQARDASDKPEEEDDLAELLLQANAPGVGAKAAFSITLLAHALAHVATTPAVRQLVKISLDHGGAFRGEVTRLVRTLGDKAVPALIEARKDPASELRHWANNTLEGMGKRIAADAVQTKDPQVLADVLRAYATTHEKDALPVILSFVNSERVPVRTAAREAIAQFGQDANTKLREAYNNVTGNPAPDAWTAADLARELFKAYDRIRLQEVYGLLEDGLKKEKEGKLVEAVEAFDKVLARQPMLDRRVEMVGAYVAYAQSLEDSDPPKSLATFHKAARLWPDGPRINAINAEIAYLEGKELLARGITDVEPFKRAVALDPTHTKARQEIERLEIRTDERQGRVRTYAAIATAVLVAICGLILFGSRRPFRFRGRSQT